MTGVEFRTGSEADQEGKLSLLPVYIVVDASESMNLMYGDRRLIDVANEIVPALVEICEERPAVRDKLRLSLIRFDDDAKVVVALGKKDDFVPIPTLATAGETTRYGNAFILLRSEIEQGVRALNMAGFTVYRPAVFFITDGNPQDDAAERDRAFSLLTDDNFKANPHVVVFGVAEANAELLRKYVRRNGKLVMAKSAAKSAEALAQMVTQLVSTLIATLSGDDGGGTFVFDPGDVDDDLLTVYD